MVPLEIFTSMNESIKDHPFIIMNKCLVIKGGILVKGLPQRVLKYKSSKLVGDSYY